jgi:hypothetical protein
VCAATVYQSPETGFSYILVVNEGLYMGNSLSCSLLNPNQIRYFGNDVWDNPYDPGHALAIHVTSNEDAGDLIISMQFEGTILSFPSRTPTQSELDELMHYHLTSPHPWEPHAITLAAVATEERDNRSSYDDCLNGLSCIFHPENLHTRMIASVNVKAVVLDRPEMRTLQSKNRHNVVSADDLSNIWGIGLETAKRTLLVTTQRGIRSAILPLSRRYRTDLMYMTPRLKQRFYSDTVYGRHRSLHGNTCAQVFTNKSYFVAVYPMESKALAGDALKQFIKEYGVPEAITVDGSQEQTARKSTFVKMLRKYDVDLHVTEPYNPRQNPAEGVIREVRRRWFRLVRQQNVPLRLWDYGFRWVCEVMQRTANSVFALEGRTPFEEITGETPDISEYLDFRFYDPIWYKDNAGLGETLLGRWLGVAHRIGSAMSYYVLKSNGKVIARTTVQRVTLTEREALMLPRWSYKIMMKRSRHS